MIARDKQLHALGGMIIVLACGVAGLSLLHAFLVACIAGLLKEIYDYFHPETHTCDMLDFVATVVGGAVGVAVLTILGK